MTGADRSPTPPEPSLPGGPLPQPPNPPAGDATAELTSAVAQITTEDIAPETRRKLLVRVVRAEIRERGARGLLKPKAAVRWALDAVNEVAPHIPVRDLATLQRHHPGLDGDALAERLIRNAARATAGIGAAGGGVAAVEWAVTPTLLSAPVLIAAETVAVVAVEMKLIGELHEVYRRPVPAAGTDRAVLLVQAWAGRRGINPLAPGAGMAAALSTATRRELRDRLMRRFSRNWTTLGPLLSGAAVAAYLNRRATLGLGAQISKELR